MVLKSPKTFCDPGNSVSSATGPWQRQNCGTYLALTTNKADSGEAAGVLPQRIRLGRQGFESLDNDRACKLAEHDVAADNQGGDSRLQERELHGEGGLRAWPDLTEMGDEKKAGRNCCRW